MRTFLFEVEECGELSALVVSAEKKDRLGEVDFDGVKEDDDFDRVGAAVDEIAEEQVSEGKFERTLCFRGYRRLWAREASAGRSTG